MAADGNGAANGGAELTTRVKMSIAGAIALALGLAAAAFVVTALVGVVGGTLSGYVFFSLVAVVFVFAGVALLAGGRVVPDRWPPRDDDER